MASAIEWPTDFPPIRSTPRNLARTTLPKEDRLARQPLIRHLLLPFIIVNVVTVAVFLLVAHSRLDAGTLGFGFLLIVGAVFLIVNTAAAFALATRLQVNIDQLRRVSRLYARSETPPEQPRHLGLSAGAPFADLARSLRRMGEQLRGQLEELRTQRAEQRAVLQSMRAGLIAIDNERRIISVNRPATEMLAIEADTTRGRLLSEVTRLASLHRFVRHAIDAEGSQSAELEAVSEEATFRLKVTAEPLVDAERGRVGLLIVMQDVSHVRRLETIRTDFAAAVSHELRTPITNIKGYIETMMELDPDEGDQRDYFLQVINRNARRLEAIVEDLLTLTGLERTTEPSGIDIRVAPAEQLIESALQQYEALAREKSITIRRDIGRDIRITGGTLLIEQALSNLLSNAIRYSPPETTITVTAAHLDSGELEISVTDQGPGIAAEHLPRLFERFYRVDQARSRQLGGTGLGLAIVKHIAQAHGGRVEVESTVGEGSRFRIILPRRDVENAA